MAPPFLFWRRHRAFSTHGRGLLSRKTSNDTRKYFSLANPSLLGCSWQGKAFEVGERSEVGALESLASNLVRLAALVALVN